MARMKTHKRKTEAEKLEEMQARLNEEKMGGKINAAGEIEYPHVHESMSADYSLDPDHPMHQPKRKTPPGSHVATDYDSLKRAKMYGAHTQEPFHGVYYSPGTHGQANEMWVEKWYPDLNGPGKAGYAIALFENPDQASDALWEEYGRTMDPEDPESGYVHEDDWHTFPGATPAEVLGEQG